MRGVLEVTLTTIINLVLVIPVILILGIMFYNFISRVGKGLFYIAALLNESNPVSGTLECYKGETVIIARGKDINDKFSVKSGIFAIPNWVRKSDKVYVCEVKLLEINKKRCFGNANDNVLYYTKFDKNELCFLGVKKCYPTKLDSINIKVKNMHTNSYYIINKNVIMIVCLNKTEIYYNILKNASNEATLIIGYYPNYNS